MNPDLEMKRVLFCPPTYFEVRDVKNPFMQGAAPVNQEMARQQWEQVRRAFSESGCEVAEIEAVPDLEDMVFANNQVFVGRSATGEPFIVPSRMRFASRQREVPYYVAWFRQQGYRILELELGDDYLEGHGDLLWDAGMKRIWAGYGIRSTRGAVEKLAAAMGAMGFEVLPLELSDARFYHLDTCLAPLAAGAVLYYPGAFSPASRDLIRQSCRAYEVGLDEALCFVCNGVAGSGRFVTPRITPGLAQALKGERLTPVLVETSEFEKSGGSVCCLKLFVF